MSENLTDDAPRQVSQEASGSEPEQTSERVTVLFVCVGNCVRSQMAEAIARHCASDVMTVESAGLRPLGFIDPTSMAVMQERGISMEGQYSKGLHSHRLATPILTINMSGVPGESFIKHRAFEDWPIADPFGEDMDTHRRICDDIEARIKILAERLRSQRGPPPKP
jgi:arsenate reductase (thioredoxin)